MAKALTVEIIGDVSKFTSATTKASSEIARLEGDVGRHGTSMSGHFQSIGQSADDGIGRAATQSSGLLSVLGPIGVAAGAAAAGIAAFGAAALVAGGTAEEYGVNVGKLERLTGGSAEQMSTMAFAAQQTGVDVDVLGKSLGRFEKGLATGTVDGFNKAMKEGAKDSEEAQKAQEKLADAQQRLKDTQDRVHEAQVKSNSIGKNTVDQAIQLRDAQKNVAEAQNDLNDAMGKSAPDLEKLGIQLRDANGALLPMNDIIGNVADKFKDMEDGPQKTALAMQLFGKQGAALIPMLNEGKEGLAQYADEAAKYGLILDQSAVDKARAAKGAQRDLSAAWQGFQVQLGQYVLPVLTKVTQWFTDHLAPAMEYVKFAIFVVQGAWERLSGAFQTGGMSGAIDELTTILGNLWSIVGPALGDLVNKIGAWIGDHWQDIAAAYGKWEMAMWGWILKAIPPILEKLGQLMVAIGGWIQNTAAPWLGAKFAEWAPVAWQWLGDVARQIPPKAQEMLAAFGAWAQGTALPWLAEKAGELARALLTWLEKAAADAPGKLGELAGRVFAWIAEQAVQLPGKLAELAGHMVRWIIDAAEAAPGKLQEFGGKIIDFLRELPGKLLEAAGNAKDWLIDAGKHAIEGLWNGIKDAIPGLLSDIAGIPGQIIDGFKKGFGISSPAKLMIPIGQNIAAGVGVGLQQGWKSDVLAPMQAMADSVPALSFGQADAQYGAANVIHNDSDLARFRSQYPGSSLAIGDIMGAEAVVSGTAAAARANAAAQPQPQVIDLHLDGYKLARALVPHLDQHEKTWR